MRIRILWLLAFFFTFLAFFSPISASKVRADDPTPEPTVTPTRTDQPLIDLLGPPTQQSYDCNPDGYGSDYGTVTPSVGWMARCSGCLREYERQMTQTAQPTMTKTVTPTLPVGGTYAPTPTITSTVSPIRYYIEEKPFSMTRSFQDSQANWHDVWFTDELTYGCEGNQLVGIIIEENWGSGPNMFLPMLGFAGMQEDYPVRGEKIVLYNARARNYSTNQIYDWPGGNDLIEAKNLVGPGYSWQTKWFDWGGNPHVHYAGQDKMLHVNIHGDWGEPVNTWNVRFSISGYVCYGTPPEPVDPDPYEPGMCDTMEDQADQTEAEIFGEYPQIMVGWGSCYTMEPKTLDFSALSWIPGFELEVLEIPGIDMCFRPIKFGELKFLGLGINLDLIAGLIGSVAILRWWMRS